jgi:APA family basic amino acid/polyamine antiporter
VAPRLTAPARRLRARSLALVAFGEVGSSLIFALGIVALYAAGVTPWVLLGVGVLVLVVTLSYAEGASALPEAGGTATFVRRAFSDPLGFVAGWVLFLDYLVVIAIAALFVPHYLGAVFGWEAVESGPWDAVSGIGVIAFVAALRWTRKVRLYPVAVVVSGLALLAQLLLAVAGLALVFDPGVLRFGTDLGETPSLGSIALALSLATLAYTGLETIVNFASEVREPGRTLPRSLFIGIGLVVVVNVVVSIVGLSAYPAVPDPAGPDGVASALGTDWLQAPLAGIADAIGGEMAWGGQALETFVGVSNALVLVTIIATAMAGGERLAYSMARYDMLPHAFARPERRERTPTPVATLAAAAIAPVLIVVADAVGDGAQFLAGLFSFGVLIAMTAGQLAVVRLRIREPELERPFRVPGAVRVGGAEVPVLPIVGAILTLALWVTSMFTHSAAAIAGPVWLVLGAVVYLLSRRAGGETLLGRATPAVPDLVDESPEDEAAREVERILVPLKLGAIGQEVLATALRLAEDREAVDRDAEVIVVHVVKVPMSLPLEAEYTEEEHRGLEAIEDAREIAAHLGVTVIGHVVRARSLAEAIIEEARVTRADLILMGSAPRWRKQARFFSPTVDEVLRTAPCEVMVVTYPEGVLEEGIES